MGRGSERLVASTEGSSSSKVFLSQAKNAKQDEFYTQLSDISNELKIFYPHLQDIEEISVFKSNDYYLEDGSDGEDTFRNAEYLFNIPLDITYKKYKSKIINI